MMNIQWYPGHIAKARKVIKQNISLVDVIIHIVDARAPRSTYVSDIKRLATNREIITVLNKKDLACENITFLWLEKFCDMGIKAVGVDTLRRQGLDKLLKEIRTKVSKKKMGAIRCMVVGVPNVGKSAILNQMAKRKATKTGNRPGVTKSKMWLKAGRNLELLDTPGVLMPKYEDEEIGINLALLGCIKQEILDTQQLSYYLIDYLKKYYPNNLKQRYKIKDIENTPSEILKQIAKNRGFLRSGGIFDIERSMETLLFEFQQGKLGKISLEKPG